MEDLGLGFRGEAELDEAEGFPLVAGVVDEGAVLAEEGLGGLADASAEDAALRDLRSRIGSLVTSDDDDD